MINRISQEREELASLDWVRELESQPAVERVPTAGAVVSAASDLPETNMVRH